MSCLLNQEMRDGLFTMVASDLFTKAKNGEALDLDQYIATVYEFAKTASGGNTALALDAAMLVPGFIDTTLANRPKLETFFESKNEDVRVEVLAKKKAFRDINKVREHLGLTESPAVGIDELKKSIEAPKPPAEPKDTTEEDLQAFKTLPLGAFYTYGSEVKNFENIANPNYMVTDPEQVVNFAGMRTVREALNAQIAAKGIADSSQMELEGVGPVFFKIYPAKEANKIVGRRYEDPGDMIAIIVDSKGKPIKFTGDGKVSDAGKPTWYKLYSQVPFKTDVKGNKILNLNKDEFIKFATANADPKVDERIRQANAFYFHKALMSKLDQLTEGYKENGMNAKDAINQAMADLTADFITFEQMREYVVKGNAVTSVITGASKGFVVQNQYQSSRLDAVDFSQGFKPTQVKKQEVDATYEEGVPYFNYPGVDQKVVIKKPALVERPEIMDTIISLFTEPLTKDGLPLSTQERNRLIEQFMFGKYSQVQFVPDKNTGSFVHADGSSRIIVNGVRFSIKYDEASAADRAKAAEAIKTFLSTGRTENVLVFKNKKEFDEASKKYGVQAVTSLTDPGINSKSVLLKDGKYYKVNMPYLELAGEKLNNVYEQPTISKGADGTSTVTLKEIPYNDFVKSTFETNATVQADGKIRPINPVISYAPTLEDLNKITSTPAIEETIESTQDAQNTGNTVEKYRADEQAELKREIPNIDSYKKDGKINEFLFETPEELQKYKEIWAKYDKLISPLLEAGPITEANKNMDQITGNTNADLSDDDIIGGMTLDKKFGQKFANKKPTEEQLKAAMDWYAKSPLGQKFPLKFKEIFNAVNTNDGPVAQWTTRASILFHYYSEDGKFDAERSGDFTDLYHEAWHGFTQTFLSEAERKKLYGTLSRRKGEFTDYTGKEPKQVKFSEATPDQLEEYAAEEFREYMMSGGKMVVKDGPVVKGIFDMILKFLNELFGSTRSRDFIENPMSYGPVFEMYKNLRMGNLAPYNFQVQNRTQSIGSLNKAMLARNPEATKPELGYEDADMLVRSMDSLISAIATNMGKVRGDKVYTTQLMKDPKTKKAAYKKVLQTFIEKKIKMQQEFTNLGDTEQDKYKRNQLDERIKLLEWAIDNFGDIEDLTKNKDQKGLIAYHAMKSKYLSDEDKESVFDEDDTDIDETQQNLDARGQSFDRSGNEVSQYEQSSPELKYLLRSIHKYDETGAPIRNMLDIHELSDSHVVWNKVARTLNGIMDRPGMYKALEEASSDPVIKELLDKLGPVDTKSAAETDLWQKFWATFNMVNIPLIQMTVETKTTKDGNIEMNSYKMTIGQANSSSSRTSLLWKNAFRMVSTDYIIRDANELTADGKDNPNFNNRYLDIDKVIKDFSDTKGKLKSGEAANFMRAIGVRLSNKPVISDAINSGKVGNAAIIFNKLKILSASGDIKNDRNIKRLYSLEEVFQEYDAHGTSQGLANDQGNLTAMADLENRHSDHTSNYAVTNAEGNTQFEQSLHNSMSIMVSTINSAATYQDLVAMPHMAHLNIKKNPQAASSIWLNSIFELKNAVGEPLSDNDPNFGKKRVKDGVEAKLNLSNLSGVQMVDMNGSDGTASASADEFTKLIMDFHMQMAGRPELMRHADKGTSFSVWLPNITGGSIDGKFYVDPRGFFADSNGSMVSYARTAKIMTGYLDAEMKRMAKLKAMQENVKSGEVVYAADYLKEGQNFVIFEDILDKPTRDLLSKYGSTEEAYADNTALRNEVNKQIENYFEDQFNQVSEVFGKNKFIDDVLLSKAHTQAKKDGYAVGEKTSSKGLSITEKGLLRSYVVNNWIHNIESMNLIYGDIAQYNMNKQEFHKRNAGAGSTGNLFAVDSAMLNYVNNKGRLYAASQGIEQKQLAMDGSFESAVIADNEIPSYYFDQIREAIAENITARNKSLSPEALEKKINEATKAYNIDEEGNAQGWMTFDFYRSASIMEGKWTSQQEQMYQDICAGKEISQAEAVQFFPTKKYQYWGPVKTADDQLPLMAFHKFSLFPLIPTVVKGTNLEKLHTKMMNQKVDYALFKSGSKIATLTKLDKSGKADQDKFYSEDRTFDEKSDFTPNTVFFHFLKNQLEIAPKYKEKVTFPTQMRKLIENGLMEAGVPTDFEMGLPLNEREKAWHALGTDAAKKAASPFYALVKRYEEDVKALTEKKRATLEKEADIKYKTVNGSRVVVVDQKLLDFIMRELDRQDLAEHEINFIKSGNKTKGIAHDLSISLSSEKLEKILNSIAVKRLVKQKFKGEGLIQVSGAGFEKNLRGELTAEEKLKYGTNELPFYTRNYVVDENGVKRYTETKAMKVKISMQGDFFKLLELKHKDGKAIKTLDRLNAMLKDEEWLDVDNHRGMISITGPRIPTQENNSMEFAEVYEFLPTEAGNIVVLPSEIVAKSGGDFDIDKITFMMPNIKSKINAAEINFKQLGEKYAELGEDGVKDIYDRRKEKSKMTDDEKKVLEDIFNSAPREVSLPMDMDSEEGLENRILDDMRQILQLKENYVSLVRPNGTDLVKPTAKELADKVMDYNPKKRMHEGDDTRIAGTRVFEIRYNLYKHGSNSIGKATLGLGAVDNTYNTVFNRIGARMNRSYTTTGGITKDLNILLPHNKLKDAQGEDVISLSHLYDASGETSISSVIAQLINGWVDIAKDAWIFNIQGNKEISPTLLFMVQAGVPVEQAIYMVSHPLIRQYVEEQKLAKSTFAKPLGKGDKNPMFFRNAARKEMYKKIFGADTAKTLGGKAEVRDTELKNITDNLYNNPEVQDFFDPTKVKQNLLDKIDNKSDTYDASDRAIFMHFLELEEMAKVTTKVKMNTNFDTSRSNTLFEAQRKTELLKDLRQEQMIPEEVIDAILDESPIGSFYIQPFQVELWQDLFKLRNNPVVNEFILTKMDDFNTYNDAVDKTFGDSEKLVNQFRNDLTSFIFQNSLRTFNVSDQDTYRGVELVKEGFDVKTVANLRHGVFVKTVGARPVIYMDKTQLANDFKALGLKKYDYQITLGDGTQITVAPVKAADFSTAETYYAFVMERELLRNEYLGKDGWALLQERGDVQSKLKDYTDSIPLQENETEEHRKARIDTMVYEETLRDMALDNTYNSSKLFKSSDSMADQLTQIQIMYPELAEKYSLVSALSASPQKGGKGINNIMLNDTMLDADKINVFHQNLLNLSNPGKIDINTDSAIERERVAKFFERLSIYAFLQSGMNTSGRYALTRLVPQEKFTSLMTTYMPGFINNVNNITLEKYWKKFISVNSDKRGRSRMRDYTITEYDPKADYKISGNGQATVADAKKYLSPIIDEYQQEVAQVDFSEDNQGNILFDANGVKGTGARIALLDNSRTLFVVNGVAMKADGTISPGNATTNEAALYGERANHPNVLGFPTRESFTAGKTGQLKDADVHADGAKAIAEQQKQQGIKVPPYTVDTNLKNADSSKRLASTRKGVIKLNPVKTVEEFFDYFEGKEGGQTSTQKKLVLDEMARQGYGIDKIKSILNTPKLINTFLVLHEQDHIDNNDEDVYWKMSKTDLLTPDKIAIEARASINAIKKITGESNAQPQASTSTNLPGPDTKINIYAGTGENADLSNFAERPFVDEANRSWNSVEQYFQFEKSIYAYNLWDYTSNRGTAQDKKDLDLNDLLSDKIRKSNNSSEIKRLGSQFKQLDRVKWDSKSSSIMKEALLMSFKQNPDALAKLLATGNSTLTHTQDKGKWGTEFPRLLMEVRKELRGEQPQAPVTGPVESTGKTDMGDDSKTIQPINGLVINPLIKKQIDSAIQSMKDYQARGYKIAFPAAGFGQYMIGADDATATLTNGKITPIAPASFVYLSQQLWDNFKFANPNFDKVLDFTGQVNVLQMNAEVNDLEVMDALSFCFKA